MISIINARKQFSKLQVLDDVSIEFQRGECVALIGPNGCGKTTLIKSILGMVIPDSGEIHFQGKAVLNDETYRKQIGYMPQIGRYPQNMTIGQVIEMICDIRKPNQPLDEELLFEFDLRKLYHKKMSTLSGGTTQKVSATLAFLFNPDVLILDEPTAGLDPISAEILKAKIIREKSNGKLIIITSHILSELDDLITALIYMQDGKILFHKTMETIRQESGEQRISKALAQILQKQALR